MTLLLAALVAPPAEAGSVVGRADAELAMQHPPQVLLGEKADLIGNGL